MKKKGLIIGIIVIIILVIGGIVGCVAYTNSKTEPTTSDADNVSNVNDNITGDTSKENEIENKEEVTDVDNSTENTTTDAPVTTDEKKEEVVANTSNTSNKTSTSSSSSTNTNSSNSTLSKSEKEAQAREVAKQIAKRCTGTTDLERVTKASKEVYNYYKRGVYKQTGSDYNTAYGVFIKGESSCAGCTRALGMVLTEMGYSWKHINPNKWEHQWVELEMDGQHGWADGMGGIANYGVRKREGEIYEGPEPGSFIVDVDMSDWSIGKEE